MRAKGCGANGVAGLNEYPGEGEHGPKDFGMGGLRILPGALSVLPFLPS